MNYQHAVSASKNNNILHLQHIELSRSVTRDRCDDRHASDAEKIVPFALYCYFGCNYCAQNVHLISFTLY